MLVHLRGVRGVNLMQMETYEIGYKNAGDGSEPRPWVGITFASGKTEIFDGIYGEDLVRLFKQMIDQPRVAVPQPIIR